LEHQPVTIADIRIPFWRLVRFFVRASIAAIPAAIILALIYALVGAIIVGILALLGLDFHSFRMGTPA
jgi:hypothetical protein